MLISGSCVCAHFSRSFLPPLAPAAQADTDIVLSFNVFLNHCSTFTLRVTLLLLTSLLCACEHVGGGLKKGAMITLEIGRRPDVTIFLRAGPLVVIHAVWRRSGHYVAQPYRMGGVRPRPRSKQSARRDLFTRAG